MSYREIADELTEWRRRRALQGRLVRISDRLRLRLSLDSRSLESVSETTQAEREDVEDLERASFKRLLARLGGNLEGRIARERDEARAAMLRQAELQQRVDATTTELRETEAELADLGDVEAGYAQALQRKAEYLGTLSGARGEKIAEDLQRLVAIGAARRELAEADIAGTRALAALDEALEHLEAAGAWGTWDMLGGGSLASLIKHGKLDDGSRAVERARALLQRLEAELSDVQNALDAEVELDLTIEVADVVYDGLFVDWLVHSRIQQSHSRLQSIRVRVAGLVTALEHEHGRHTERHDQLWAEFEAVVESS